MRERRSCTLDAVKSSQSKSHHLNCMCSRPPPNVDHSPMEWPRPPPNANGLIISRKTDTDCDANTDCITVVVLWGMDISLEYSTHIIWK